MNKSRGVEIRNDLKELLVEVPFDLANLKANIILPEIGVTETAGTMKVLPAKVAHKLGDTVRADSGAYDRTTFNLAEDDFRTRLYGCEEAIDNIAELETSSIFSQEEVAGMMARNRLLLGREKRVADTVFNTTTFTGAGYTGAASKVWSDVTADFRDDIWEAHKKIRSRLMLGLGSMSLILTSDRIRDMIETLAAKDAIKYNVAMLLNNEASQLSALATYIGVKQIVAVDPMADKAGLDLKGDFDFLYPNNQAMLAVLSGGANSWRIGGLGRQPVFTKLASDYLMESYDEEATDTRVVRAKEYRGQKVFKDYGFLLTGIA